MLDKMKIVCNEKGKKIVIVCTNTNPEHLIRHATIWQKVAKLLNQKYLENSELC